jgi:hypothetical protein
MKPVKSEKRLPRRITFRTSDDAHVALSRHLRSQNEICRRLSKTDVPTASGIVNWCIVKTLGGSTGVRDE